MSGIVNLNQARKAAARKADASRAAANRVRFGRSKADKEATNIAEAQARRALDGHRRDPSDGSSEC